MSKLNSVLESPDSKVIAQSYEEDDGEGKKLRLTLWNHPGSDITGMINRCEKVVNTCKEVIDWLFGWTKNCKITTIHANKADELLSTLW